MANVDSIFSYFFSHTPRFDGEINCSFIFCFLSFLDMLFCLRVLNKLTDERKNSHARPCPLLSLAFEVITSVRFSKLNQNNDSIYTENESFFLVI